MRRARCEAPGVILSLAPIGGEDQRPVMTGTQEDSQGAHYRKWVD